MRSRRSTSPWWPALALAVGAAGCSGGEPERGPISLVLPTTTAPPVITAAPTDPPLPVDAWRADVGDCPSSATAVIGDRITLGVVGPTGTGLPALGAAGYVEGMRTYIDAANADGMVPGVTIELVVGDDAGDPTRTAVVVDELLAGGVDVFVGGLGSDTVAAIDEALAGRCVPHLAAAGLQINLDDPQQYPWTTAGTANALVEVSAYDAAAPGATVAVVRVEDAAGSAYAEAVDQVYGDRVVASAAIAAGALSVGADVLAPVAAAQPDIVMVAASAAECPAVLRALGALTTGGWSPQVAMARSCNNPVVARLAGAAIEGVWSTSELADVTSSEAVAALSDQVGASDSPLFLPNAVAGYHAAELAVTAIAAAAAAGGGLTPAGVIEGGHALDLVPTMALAGTPFSVNGSVDVVGPDTLQVVRWTAAGPSASPVGEPYRFAG